jgi:hypothetical protein
MSSLFRATPRPPLARKSSRCYPQAFARPLDGLLVEINAEPASNGGFIVAALRKRASEEETFSISGMLRASEFPPQPCRQWCVVVDRAHQSQRIN